MSGDLFCENFADVLVATTKTTTAAALVAKPAQRINNNQSFQCTINRLYSGCTREFQRQKNNKKETKVHCEKVLNASYFVVVGSDRANLSVLSVKIEKQISNVVVVVIFLLLI